MLTKDKWIWAAGIEDTFVTQTAKGERPLDEYELTQHYQFWQSDLDLVKRSGATMIRYGIPWYKVEPVEGEFDWSWIDHVMEYFRKNDALTPIIDLMHYGTPHWLVNEFVHDHYPYFVSRYAKEFANRYRDVATYYTPLNEPYVNAEFCGLNGVWPPYLDGLSGFYQIAVQLGKGIIQTVYAIKEVVPDATMVHVDATKRYVSNDPHLQDEVDLWNENRFVMWELLSGRIFVDHPLYSFMKKHGVAEEDFQWFQNHAISFDIVGLNYYPQFSVHEVTRDEKGYIVYPHRMGTGIDLEKIINEAYRRYDAPIMITETSFNGTDHEKTAWLEECVQSCKKLRGTKNSIDRLDLVSLSRPCRLGISNI
ncbi:family 1 glycosylhydrolase [Alkalihalobacillus sp. AL-G]|uniref:family 1 glycosylhydrolase n=1 Tax=Alkalihalobacillus sp. AL-G TaxID=2926399 RepID=UPI00272AF3A3|nr:family 1 glycosylhydrolase [Alkalihalobacillus sp. AL-G]WLD95461.1 family 1 glycosylhydrolase [Alkalihalobacillus sp. AL-G]